MRIAKAAEAAADKLRNERRDADETLCWLVMTHPVRAILPHSPAGKNTCRNKARQIQ
jgi:hypothetical protein